MVPFEVPSLPDRLREREREGERDPELEREVERDHEWEPLPLLPDDEDDCSLLADFFFLIG